MKKRIFQSRQILRLFTLVPFWLLALNSYAQVDVLHDVSLVNLIATPERYDGKLVFIKGFVSIGLENMSICPSKDTLSTKDCMWLNIDSGPYETNEDMRRFESKEKIWKQFHGKVVSIRGTFDKNDTGHLGGWSGAIKNVIDIYGKNKHVQFDLASEKSIKTKKD